MCTLLGLYIFFGLPFAFDDSFVLAAAGVGIMRTLRESMALENVIFNSGVFLCVFDSVSF